jgi:hypothetical protein
MISKLAAFLLLAAPAAVTAPAAAAASSQTSPQAALDGLLSADRQFGSSKLGLVPAIERMLDETAIMPLPTGTFAQGKQAVLASLRSNPANASAKADWAPVRAGISADGTHGFTFGFMTISEAGKPDRPVKYLAYWVKRPDGWRVAAYKRAPRPEGPVSPALREPALPSKLVKPGSARPAHKASLIAAEKAFSDAAQKIGLGPAFEKFGSADAMFIGRDLLLRRSLGRFLVDQPHRLVQRHRLRIGALRQGRMCRAVADIGPVAPFQHLQLLAAFGMRAKHRDRLARRAALPPPAGRRVGQLGDGRVHARLEHLGGRCSRAYLPSWCTR